MKKMHTLTVTKLAALALVLTALVLVPIGSQAATVNFQGNTATGIRNLMVLGTLGRVIFPSWINPNAGAFAMMAMKYFERYGISIEEGKNTLARISVKSHHNGAMNPKAHLRREISVEDVLKAPVIAWPLGLFDCCGVGDGSAAVIVARADMAKNFRSDPVYIKAIQVNADSGHAKVLGPQAKRFAAAASAVYDRLARREFQVLSDREQPKC